MSASITQAIQAARCCLSEYWPLSSFIATNPLWQCTDQHFLQVMQSLSSVSLTMPISFYQAQLGKTITKDDLMGAIADVLNSQDQQTDQQYYDDLLHDDVVPQQPALLLSQQLETYQYQNAVDWVHSQCCEVLLQFFGQAQQTDDLMTFWQTYWHANVTTITSTAVSNREHCIMALLDEIGVAPQHYTTYLQQIALSLYGWGSLIKWLQSHPSNPWLSHQADIETLLIMWLNHEVTLKQHTGQSHQTIGCDDITQQQQQRHCQKHLIWQLAYEQPYQRQLLAHINTYPQAVAQIPEAQLICCIDVRSEGLRRHLEQQGHYATYGIAGFFGFGFQLEHNDGQCSLQCPALLTPDIVVQYQEQQQSLLLAWQAAALRHIKQAKHNLLSPFVLFELLGVWLLPKLLHKTYAPAMFTSSNQQPAIAWQSDGQTGFSIEAATESAYQLLTTLHLIDDFAPTIVICAHQSTSENNPFAAALDCGACGGNSGIPNAIIAAQALNHPEVRAGLRQRGIAIPDQTQFIAACHHTTRDEVEWLTTKPSTTLQQDMQVACQQLRQERLTDLPGRRHVKHREHDWAELIPELGLANNAAMIVGPRWLTKQVDLQRRTFLHSYEPSQDADGNILEAIMCAPVVVAHWINSQYYMSTVCPKVFGAGNKAIHNVIPGVGVMAGNLSDLKIGLPEQSVRYRNQLLHEPRRLFVVLYADPRQVEAIFTKHPMLANLRDGGWIRFHVIDSTTQHHTD